MEILNLKEADLFFVAGFNCRQHALLDKAGDDFIYARDKNRRRLVRLFSQIDEGGG